MMALLLKINKTVTNYKQQGKIALPGEEITLFEESYSQIMNEWWSEESLNNNISESKQGQGQTKDENLGNRFNLKRHLILRFMYDFNVEFTNNLAE